MLLISHMYSFYMFIHHNKMEEKSDKIQKFLLCNSIYGFIILEIFEWKQVKLCMIFFLSLS